MDIDYTIENNQVFFVIKENTKERAKKRKKLMVEAEDSLRQMVLDRIHDKTGDC